MNCLNSAMPLAIRLHAAETGEDSPLANELAENPRARELAIALEYQMRQPGSLDSYSDNTVTHQVDSIGTEAMRRIGNVASYTLEQSFSVWSGLPSYTRREFPSGGENWRLDLIREEMARFDRSQFPDSEDDLDEVIDKAMMGDAERRLLNGDCSEIESDWIKRHVIERKSGNPFKAIIKGDTILAAALAKITPAAMKALCIEQAQSDLPAHLKKLAIGSAFTFTDGPWYWDNLFHALVREMDLRAETIIAGIAQTEVYRVTADTLGFCYHTKKPARWEAIPRFGKSIVGKTHAHAYPGRERYLTVPWSNRESHLIEEVGKVFGLEGTGKQLEEAVEFVCQTFKIVLILDEAHGLFPTKFSKNTSPGRLQWCRLELIKHDVPLALICTPQTYRRVESRFTKATDFAIEQFNGCFVKFPRMPDRITFEELVVIGKTYLPGVAESIIEEIAAAAKATGQYLTYFEAVALNADWIAKRAGRTEITSDDIDLAIIEATPPDKRIPDPPQARDRRPPEADATRKPKPSRSVLPVGNISTSHNRPLTPGPMEAPSRHTTPIFQPV